jgi:hypothetical protein
VLKHLSVILISISVLTSIGQASSAKYQPGTITAVKSHQNVPGEPGDDATRYDVSVKIKNVVYVVLYTPQTGDHSVEYYPGLELLFLVKSHSLSFNSKTAGTIQVPILRREILPDQSGIDWSKAPSQYFTMKQEHLSDALDLTEDQQAKIKPLMEQEAGEASSILWTPVVPAKDRVKAFEKIVRASDAKIKAFLSPAQTNTLVELRKRQETELKQLMAEMKTSERN